MPFKLPEYDAAFGRFVGDTVRELARARDPVLAQMRFETMPSTVSSRVRTREGLDVELEPVASEFDIAVQVTAVREGRFEAFSAELDQAADQLAKQLVQNWVLTMDKVTRATGNIVDAGGEFTFEKLYEALEKIEIDVDESGELRMPSLVMHPDTAKQLPVPTPEQQARLAELYERKREEAIARRRSRRLS